MDTVLLILRLANIAIGLLCLFFCVTKASHYWRHYSDTAKAFVTSLTLFSFASVWGTGEQVAQDVPPGSRVIVTAGALGLLLYALWTTRGRSFYIEFRPEYRDPDEES